MLVMFQLLGVLEYNVFRQTKSKNQEVLIFEVCMCTEWFICAFNLNDPVELFLNVIGKSTLLHNKKKSRCKCRFDVDVDIYMMFSCTCKKVISNRSENIFHPIYIAYITAIIRLK